MCPLAPGVAPIEFGVEWLRGNHRSIDDRHIVIPRSISIVRRSLSMQRKAGPSPRRPNMRRATSSFAVHTTKCCALRSWVLAKVASPTRSRGSSTAPRSSSRASRRRATRRCSDKASTPPIRNQRRCSHGAATTTGSHSSRSSRGRASPMQSRSPIPDDASPPAMPSRFPNSTGRGRRATHHRSSVPFWATWSSTRTGTSSPALRSASAATSVSTGSSSYITNPRS